MSGGYFNYELSSIVDEIEQVIIEAKKEWEEIDNFSFDIRYDLSEKTIIEFEKGLEYIRLAKAYAQRIDWLVSGDDSEENFHERLKQDLENLKCEK